MSYTRRIVIITTVALAVLAGGIALMVWASGYTPSQVTGTVVSKEYEPAEFKNKRTCASKNSAGKCIRYTTKRTLVDGEEWEVVVRDGRGREHELDVSRRDFDRVQVGSAWPPK